MSCENHTRRLVSSQVDINNAYWALKAAEEGGDPKKLHKARRAYSKQKKKMARASRAAHKARVKADPHAYAIEYRYYFGLQSVTPSIRTGTRHAARACRSAARPAHTTTGHSDNGDGDSSSGSGDSDQGDPPGPRPHLTIPFCFAQLHSFSLSWRNRPDCCCMERGRAA